MFARIFMFTRFLFGPGTRADTQVCPYGIYGVRTGVLDDCVEMVGHDDVFVAFDIGKFVFQFTMPFFYHLSWVVQNHFPVNDVAEQTFSVFGANGHEIRPGPGIIISRQPDRSLVRPLVFFFHIQTVSTARDKRLKSVDKIAGKQGKGQTVFGFSGKHPTGAWDNACGKDEIDSDGIKNQI